MAIKNKKIELNAQKREVVGGGLTALRNSGFVPAVLYGRNQESIALQVPVRDFKKAFNSAGESTLIFINLDGKSYPTIIHDVDKDALSDSILHADFYKVNLDEKIKAKVAVVFQGESSAVKDLGGIFVRNINELEIEALPQDLPHEVVIDISSLKNIGDQILVKDLKLGEGLKVVAEDNEIIATVQEPMSEAELEKALETPTTTVEDVEVIKKEKEEEIPVTETELDSKESPEEK